MKIPNVSLSKHAKYRFNIILLFLILIPNIIYSQHKYLRAKYFTLEDGLSQVSCNNLLLDNFGFIWIGTENGLNRFDGTEFKHFKYSKIDSLTISGNYINKLLVDKTKKIWIGTLGDGLNYYNEDQEIFHRVKLKFSKFENEIISDLASDETGNIWVASRISGLHRLQLSKDDSISQKNYFSNQHLSSLLLDKNNNLWVGSLEGDIFKRKSVV